jgi:hypothetical protein
MIYMWFTGITVINWPLRKILTLFLRPYGNQTFINKTLFWGERKVCARITPGSTHSPTSITSVFAVYMLNFLEFLYGRFIVVARHVTLFFNFAIF